MSKVNKTEILRTPTVYYFNRCREIIIPVTDEDGEEIEINGFCASRTPIDQDSKPIIQKYHYDNLKKQIIPIEDIKKLTDLLKEIQQTLYYVGYNKSGKIVEDVLLDFTKKHGDKLK